MAEKKNKTDANVHFNETENTYELGAEVDGVWVPFSTVKAGLVETYKLRSEAADNSKE